MASPLFRPMQAPKASGHTARSIQTALFVHRMKSSLAKPKTTGHQVIHQPIIVRPAKPSHTNHTSNLPLY